MTFAANFSISENKFCLCIYEMNFAPVSQKTNLSEDFVLEIMKIKIDVLHDVMNFSCSKFSSWFLIFYADQLLLISNSRKNN